MYASLWQSRHAASLFSLLLCHSRYLVVPGTRYASRGTLDTGDLQVALYPASYSRLQHFKRRRGLSLELYGQVPMGCHWSSTDKYQWCLNSRCQSRCFGTYSMLLGSSTELTPKTPEMYENKFICRLLQHITNFCKANKHLVK